VIKILAKLKNGTSADQNVIALINFFFAFPIKMIQKGINQVFQGAVDSLDVAGPGFLNQLGAFLDNLLPESRQGFLAALSNKESVSLHDLVLIWDFYSTEMPLDSAFRIANMCLQLLADKEFDSEVLSRANLLFADIPAGEIASDTHTLKLELNWTTDEHPWELNAEILLKWCCESSPEFADMFVKHFELIFEGSIATAKVLEILLPIYLRAVLKRDAVKSFEVFVDKVKRDSMDQEKIAALFIAMSKIQKTDLWRLDSLTMKIWEDPCSAGSAELDYLKTVLKFYHHDRLALLVSQLVEVVRGNCQEWRKCGDSVVKQFELLFECQPTNAETIRQLAGPITNYELTRVFSGNGLRILDSLLNRRITSQ
jgi:hypothetical protein